MSEFWNPGHQPGDGPLKLTIRNPKPDVYTAHHKGRRVGAAIVWNDLNHGQMSVYKSETHPNYRGRGVMSSLYQHIEKERGKPLTPSSSLSDDGFALWKKFRPSAVSGDLRNHRDKLLGKEVSHPVFGDGTISRVGSGVAIADMPSGKTFAVSRDLLRAHGHLGPDEAVFKGKGEWDGSADIKGWMSPRGVPHLMSGYAHHAFDHHPDIRGEVAKDLRGHSRQMDSPEAVSASVGAGLKRGYARFGVYYGEPYVHYDKGHPEGKKAAAHALSFLKPDQSSKVYVTDLPWKANMTAVRGSEKQFTGQGETSRYIQTGRRMKMHAETRRILAGGDIERVLREGDLMQQASSFFSGIKNFSFGSGTLAKVAGTSGGGATTPTPTTGSTSAPNPGFGGKSMADLAQDAAKQQGRGGSAPPPNQSTIKPPAAPATKPATEGSVPMPRKGILGKASSLSASLKSAASLGDTSIRKNASLTGMNRPDEAFSARAAGLIEAVAEGVDPYRFLDEVKRDPVSGMPTYGLGRPGSMMGRIANMGNPDKSHPGEAKVLRSHGYEFDGDFQNAKWSRFEHPDGSHVNLYVGGDWEHKGADKSVLGKRGTGPRELTAHLRSLGKTKTESDEGRHELFYGSGGHGGPYQGYEVAKQRAVALLKGSRSERSIKIHPHDAAGVGGYGKHVGQVWKGSGNEDGMIFHQRGIGPKEVLHQG